MLPLKLLFAAKSQNSPPAERPLDPDEKDIFSASCGRRILASRTELDPESIEASLHVEIGDIAGCALRTEEC